MAARTADGASFVVENSGSSAIHIFVLVVAHAPDKCQQTNSTEQKRYRDQDEQMGHAFTSSSLIDRLADNLSDNVGAETGRFNLILLATTKIDDADIASAATNGVARPRTATGIAMQL